MPGRLFSLLLISLISVICHGIPIKVQDSNTHQKNTNDVILNNNPVIANIVYGGAQGTNNVMDKDWLKNAIREEKLNEEDIPANGELFEKDIVMDERLRRMILPNTKKSALLKKRNILWPGGIIYYAIEDSFLPEYMDMLNQTFQQFEYRTCIKFKQRTSEMAYVVFSSAENSCSSNVGRTGGRQLIRLGKDCDMIGTFEHEIMHALGFVHEHSRPDRDKYVKVHFENIDKNDTVNFQKYPFDKIDNLNEEYNFASLMHYPNTAFTNNSRDTITSIYEPGLRFGQRLGFSIGDVRQVNKLYKCEEFLKSPNYHGLFKNYHANHKRTSSKSHHVNHKPNKPRGFVDWMYGVVRSYLPFIP